MTPAMRTAHSPLGTKLPTRQVHKLPLRAISGATQGPAVLTPPQSTAYRDLMEAVASHAGQVPCLNKPDLNWLSEDDTETTAAAAACTKCPALTECARYAKTHLPTPESGPASHSGNDSHAATGTQPHDEQETKPRQEHEAGTDARNDTATRRRRTDAQDRPENR